MGRLAQIREQDPDKIGLSDFLKYTGLDIAFLSLLLLIIPLFQIKELENIDKFVTNGIFSFIRHPLYPGMIFRVFGYPLFQMSAAGLISSPLWIINIMFRRFLEEKGLLSQYKEYSNYKLRTIF